jgi:hypothetical protein
MTLQERKEKELKILNKEIEDGQRKVKELNTRLFNLYCWVSELEDDPEKYFAKCEE